MLSLSALALASCALPVEEELLRHRQAGSFSVRRSGAAPTPWYVDSVNGDDSKDGRTAATAFKTLAKLKASDLQRPYVVYLACGSLFREELTGIPAGVEVRTYGMGPKPIIDGSDISMNGLYTKTGGRTFVYQVAWTASFDVSGGKTQHRAWEDGVRMRRVSDVATCDATPGSFYAPDPTGGTDTIYVHASDNSDVRVNGKVYELSQRKWALQLYDFDQHAHVYGLECRRNAHADGSIAIDGGIHSCISRDGRVHNIFIRGVCEDTDAIGMEPSTFGFSTSFIVFGDSQSPWSNGRNGSFTRCRALPDTGIGALGNLNRDTNVGFYIHMGDSFQWGRLSFDSCYAEECLTAYDAAQIQTCAYYKCTTGANVKFAYAPHAGNVDGTQGTVVILGGTINVTGLDSQLLAYSDDFEIPDTLIMRGVRCYKTGGGIGPIVCNIAGTNWNISRCTFAMPSNGGVPELQAGSFTFSECVFSAVGNLTFRLGAGTSPAPLPPYIADYNAYWNAADSSAHFQTYSAPPINYAGIVAWRAATGQEAHSIVADPMLADPVNGNFTIGNPAVSAIAGAMIEEMDAVLQALWAQYRVA